ncbi:YaaC family protein [Pullulanibacillus sp. KACC 23026]|uniref:YaaC family protein n=1 Tax=Pullulanibacillus sp. KACC 23026 TaxID=3028315 RepID=UPI0023B13599|nr:YaaC family protein [Pullulanibacillus sp. KACC 23026]WEG12776.1 YaaC family protein [Pullulanibacillus sp. KACC 23026]
MNPDTINAYSFFLPYQSASFSQKFLRRVYEHQQIDEPNAKSYQNGYAFTYYLIHGQRFFEQTLMAPYEIKPLLLFYGTVQFCKACLLTVDQDYPKNATVLAHGVSTRKLKKQNFEFLHDTVLIQKKGLFSHMASMLFNRPLLEGRKYQMDELLHFFPELNSLHIKIREKPLCHSVTQLPEGTYQANPQLLTDLAMTKDRFFQYFGSFIDPIYRDKKERSEASIIPFKLKKGVSIQDVFLQDNKGICYLSSFRMEYPLLPELLVYYLILYNLSMITRYETEWWNDLFLQRSSNDLSFIQAIIDSAQTKIPFLVNQFLESKDPI